jgi:outer membrane biosynthesis protein TonB
MIGSLALHVAIAIALMISWSFTRTLKVGAAVPVTIVANAPETDLKAAEQAPAEQAAATDQPVNSAPAQSATPPQPQPKPAPPAPAPAPTPKAALPKPAPAPAKPTPPKLEKSLDLDVLSASLSKLAKPARPSSAPKGTSRPETALQARPTLGDSAAAAAAISGLADELQRRWNPNCDVEGGRDVKVRVTFAIGASGQVSGEPAAEIRSARTAVAQAAASRAVSAVYAAAPFRNLPREFYGERIAVNFNAREACS